MRIVLQYSGGLSYASPPHGLLSNLGEKMEDIAGVGKAAEKFLDIVKSSVGTLYRPRAIRKEGKAEADTNAYKIVATAQAEAQAKLIVFDGEQQLAERAVARLKHQELQKQQNIEDIIEQAIPHIEEKSVSSEQDSDWLSYFFDSCSNISNDEIQNLWSKTLAAKVTSNASLPKKVIDCLRWLDPELAKQFSELAIRVELFNGFFGDEVTYRKRALASIGTPFNVKVLEEIGLIKENVSKSFDFECFSLRINFQELSDRSLEFRRFYNFTPSGRSLARIVVPEIAQYFNFIGSFKDHMKALEIFHSESYGTVRDKAERLLMSRNKKMNLAVGSILHFLLNRSVSIRIEKVIHLKQGRHVFHTPGDVLVLVRNGKSNKVSVKKNTNGPHWKAMGVHELKFIDEIIAYVEANKGIFDAG